MVLFGPSKSLIFVFFNACLKKTPFSSQLSQYNPSFLGFYAQKLCTTLIKKRILCLTGI